VAGNYYRTSVHPQFELLVNPLSNPFFLPYAYTEESDYASVLILQIPGTILPQLGRDFFLVNFFRALPGGVCVTRAAHRHYFGGNFTCMMANHALVG
jgi:hypothetical protein